jgi:hypothetical protein
VGVGAARAWVGWLLAAAAAAVEGRRWWLEAQGVAATAGTRLCGCCWEQGAATMRERERRDLHNWLYRYQLPLKMIAFS